jgi:hypothetical protein
MIHIQKCFLSRMDVLRKMYKYVYVMLGLVIVSCNQGKWV